MTTLDPLPYLYTTYSDNIEPEDGPSITAYSHRDSNEVKQGVSESLSLGSLTGPHTICISVLRGPQRP